MKLYPSMYTPMAGATTNATYPQGCLRYISVKHLLPRTEIHPISQAIGRIVEERYAAKIDDGDFVSREVPAVYDAEGCRYTLSGRIDYLYPDRVVEVKGSTSASKRAMWRRGACDMQHLGQIVTYMALTGRSLGTIACSYVHFNRALELSFEDFTFNVQINHLNHIYVNDVLQDVTVLDILSFYDAAARAIESGELSPMPLYTKPCDICPFNQVCKNSPQDQEEFARHVIHVVSAGVPVGGFEPKIKTHNRN